ncbi:ERVV1 protein, partial [Neodrepanis coruscans]|nr:ERVV1 protein [Neodrepanis coruscans]
ELERALLNISAVVEHVVIQTTDAIQVLQEEVHNLSHVVLQNRMALNYFLASQGGLCA